MRRSALFALVAVLAAGCGGDEGTPPADTIAGTTPTPERTTPPGRTTTTPAEAPLAVAVDRRVELLSILSRLAGVPPYGQAATPYARAVDRAFARYGSHAAVRATAALARERGVSHDAPMQLAAHLDDDLAASGTPPRYRGADLAGYLRDVRAFAADSGFDAFLRAHAGYYRAVEAALRPAAPRAAVAWLDGLLGARGGNVRVVPGLLTGGFGFSAAAGRDVMPVVFLERPDARGVPRPGQRSTEYLVHEIAHGYVNPALDAGAASLRAAALPLYRRVEAAMRRQSYPSYTIMVDESVVRAVTVLYLRENVGAQAARAALAEHQRLSFFWTAPLVDALARAPRPIARDALVALTRRVLADAR